MKAKLIKTGKSFILKDENGGTLGITEGTIPGRKLSLKNCQAIENGYDLDELVDKEVEEMSKGDERAQRYFGFIHGFQKALEILGDKKFSEEDVMLGWDAGVMSKSIIDSNWLGPIKQEKLKKHRDSYKENLKPLSLKQTEWEVEVEMEEKWIAGTSTYGHGEYELKPKLDVNNCLILKRI